MARHKPFLTKSVRPVTKKSKTWIPVPSSILRRLKLDSKEMLYWTIVDGVLQLSAKAPVMVISVLDSPEERFGNQRGR